MDSEAVLRGSESNSAIDKQQSNVRIVGIGASAGGLEVLRELMESLPHSNSLSYIIAQHVSPTHVSVLMNLLAPLTCLTVQDLVDKQLPEPGIVYITPPNSDVVLEKGRLRLTKPKQPIGPKPSVNHFFHSLADELEEQAIGIILSGTGSDGASGMRAIKAVGGITIVQEPDTAKYDGMPKAAILTGSVDLILSPNEIGAALARLMDQPRDLSIALSGDRESDEYTQVGNLVRSNTAFKLSEYKQGTVRRRIARRMNILGIGTISEYIEHLKSHKDESLLLMRDTFISVTAFFRDQEAFFALERVIGEIVSNQKDKGVIRCWVPGCASGEEVYSIAMLFEEAMRGEKNTAMQYMIFASDLDDDAVERARAALYPISELETVPKALRDLYTEVVGDHCRILKSIRSRVVFARQNVIDDPPFARLDLISCRNLMIYLNQPVQKRVMEIFHYALNPGGYLFLGKSEGADMHRDLFKAVDSRARIYQRQKGVAHYALPVTQGVPRAQSGSVEYSKNATTSTDLISMRTLEELTERYAPPSLVVNDEDSVVHFQGNLKPYLNFPKGSADMYLFDLLDASVRAELRALVYRCRRDIQSVEGASWTVEIGGKSHVVTPRISPLEPGQRSLLLVSFLTIPLEEGKKIERVVEATERESLIISELEQELANTRTHLNIVVEELETSNEELQSLNEELQSANEEMQSTNEELQTSNEELQSTNEELLTVNEELQVKTAELESTASDLINVKQSLAFPLIVVDKQLRITQVNDACSAIVALDSPLEGCSLNSVQWLVDVPGLSGDVRRVMQEGSQFRGVCIEGETVYQLHIMPYRPIRGELSGAVLLFDDITAQHLAETALRESNERYDLAVQGTNDGIWDWKIPSNQFYMAPHFKEILGHRDDEIESSFQAWESRLHPDDKARTLTALAAHLKDGIPYEVEYRLRHKSGDYLWIRMRGEVIRDRHGDPLRMAGSITDITARRAAEDELRLAASVFSNTLDGILITTPDGKILKVNKAFERMLGYSTDEIIGQHTRILRSGRHGDDFYRTMWKEIAEHGIWQGEIWDRHKDGHMVPVWLSISTLYDNDGKVERYIALMYDISEQKESQKHINYLAHFDALTGLPNRFLFTDRLGHALAQVKRQQRKLALFFIDLDNFKHINDTRGHPMGDELLSQVAKRLTAITRESDTVARLSGDEFTLLIEDTIDDANVRMTAQKILKILSEPFDLTDGQAFVTASIGIAIFPEDGDSIDSLLKHADLAMYRSKEVGRNHFNFYTQEMSDRVQERMTLHNSLRQALDQKALELHYQPIMNVGMGTCVGAEALIRWQHSDMGWVSPTKFIPVAEESDLIHSLGEWVLQTACLQMNGWLKAGMELGSLAVNVSGKQIVIGDFVNIARRVLEETGCPSERIVLELTESFIMRESEGAIKALNQLRALGFGIAIDDFGTGYSSLSYLKRLPVTKLKLDQSFVQDIPGDPNDAAIARAILGLGDILGLEVVAEGVESKEQHKFLLSEGCAQSQGFLYSRPLTSPTFANFIPNGNQF